MPNCTIIESKIVNENKIFENLFAGWRAKETNKSKKLVCLFFIPRIIKYYVFWSDFNRKSLHFYV